METYNYFKTAWVQMRDCLLLAESGDAWVDMDMGMDACRTRRYGLALFRVVI